jgi:hypothetical protein
MEYITTFSFQAPTEKTELAPTGQPVTIAAPVEDAVLDSFFCSPPPYSHHGGRLAPLSAAAPRLLTDDFKRFLDRAKAT